LSGDAEARGGGLGDGGQEADAGLRVAAAAEPREFPHIAGGGPPRARRRQ
jgi:hypothetical protein